jgi:hypothetical protein
MIADTTATAGGIIVVRGLRRREQRAWHLFEHSLVLVRLGVVFGQYHRLGVARHRIDQSRWPEVRSGVQVRSLCSSDPGVRTASIAVTTSSILWCSYPILLRY